MKPWLLAGLLKSVRSLLVYHPDTGVLIWRCPSGFHGRIPAGSIAGHVNRTGYRSIRIGPRRYQAHRLAWLYVTGEWPKEYIDHVNGEKDDNRWINLREATQSQNKANSRIYCNNKSGFKGVSWVACRGRWRAQIKINKKYRHLGYFNAPEAAHAAYLSAAKESYGQFARAA